MVVRGLRPRALVFPPALGLALALTLTLGSLALTACEDPGPGPARPGDAGPTDGSAVPAHLTWYRDVAPITYTECVMCHRPMGIAPFSMLDEGDVRANAGLMKQKTMAREMPPMPVNNAGDCNTFSNARWLTEEEIDTIARWADGGAALGDPADAPAVPAPPLGLADANVTLDSGSDYAPHPQTDGQPDDYHCFVVDPMRTTDGFVTGYEVEPGDDRVVHHMIVYSVPTDAALTEAMTNDMADASTGYTCFGGPGVRGSEPLAVWAPGVGPTRYPTGTGLRLEAGRRVIVQVHYNLPTTVAPPYVGRTTVRLRVSDARAGTERAYLAPVAWLGLDVPAGQMLATGGTSIALPEWLPTVRAWGAIPHMHTLGRTLHVTSTSGGATECLVDVDRWNFHWQNVWWYETPVPIERGSSVRIDCGYDTRTRMSSVTWGEGTSDEMCLAYFYVTL